MQRLGLNKYIAVSALVWEGHQLQSPALLGWIYIDLNVCVRVCTFWIQEMCARVSVLCVSVRVSTCVYV